MGPPGHDGCGQEPADADLVLRKDGRLQLGVDSGTWVRRTARLPPQAQPLPTVPQVFHPQSRLDVDLLLPGVLFFSPRDLSGCP